MQCGTARRHEPDLVLRRGHFDRRRPLLWLPSLRGWALQSERWVPTQVWAGPRPRGVPDLPFELRCGGARFLQHSDAPFPRVARPSQRVRRTSRVLLYRGRKRLERHPRWLLRPERHGGSHRRMPSLRRLRELIGLDPAERGGPMHLGPERVYRRSLLCSRHMPAPLQPLAYRL